MVTNIIYRTDDTSDTLKIKTINCLDYNSDNLSNDELKSELSRIDSKFKKNLYI